MPGIWKSIKPRLFWICLFIYVGAGLLNLAYVPVVWLDEAANLEPALYYFNTGIYAAKSWSVPGAENIFLSYPPAITWFNLLSLHLFPLSVFWIRLPFLLLHAGTAILLYRLLKNVIKTGDPAATILVLFFLFDKAVFEISRACRSEVIELFLLAILLLFTFKKTKGFIPGLALGLLLLTHLKEWPFAAVYGLYFLLFQLKKTDRIVFIIFSLLPLLLFLAFTGFNFHEIYRQMIVYSGEHAAKTSFLHRLADGFFYRFFPVYKEQPWMPLLHGLMWLAAMLNLKKSRGKDAISVTFMFTDICCMLVMSPNYRYWIPSLFTGYVVLAIWLKNTSFNWQLFFRWYMIPVYALLFFPFFSRHLLGISQRPERDPVAAIRFLETHIRGEEKTLVFGEEIGVYMAGKHKNYDFGHTIEPDHFHPEDYKNIFFLSHKKYPHLTPLSTYQPDTFQLPSWAYKLGRGGTYAGMHIYKLVDKKEWEMVTEPYFRKSK